MKVIFFMVALFIFMGVAVKYFKWYFLISGYNTMSRKRKENVDVEGLGNLMGNFMFYMAFLMGLSGVFQFQGFKTAALICLLLIMPSTIFLIIKAQKYDHNERKSTDKGSVIVVVGLISLILLIVSGILLYGILEPKVEVNAERIIISGMYKRIIEMEDIVSVSLEEDIPRVLKKNGGFDFGYILRGNFTLEDYGFSSIFIHENISPYIVIDTGDRMNIINFKEPNRTIELYDEIMAKKR